MKIGKPLVSEYLQCVKGPNNEVGKNTVAVVCTNSHCNEEVTHVTQNIFMFVSMFLSLSLSLWTSLQLGNASTMEVNTNWKSLRIVIVMDLKRSLNWLKIK